MAKNGKKSYFRNTCFDLNTLGATEIAADKDYANYFLKLMGYPTIPGRAFYSNDWAKAIKSDQNLAAAYRYAKRIGLPLVIKPNSKSQGLAVTQAHNRMEFYQAMREVFKHDRVALVQKIVTGNDYRIVVLDGKIISAYQRIALSVTGDSKSTVRALLQKKQARFQKLKRDTQINFKDPRIKAKLGRQGLTWPSVIPKGETVFLLDNANLSTGGDALDVTPNLHPTVRDLAIRITADMGLRYCGVDLMIQGLATEPLGKYHVIEVNAAPGIDNYFAGGKKQEKIVEKLYLQVLKSMS